MKKPSSFAVIVVAILIVDAYMVYRIFGKPALEPVISDSSLSTFSNTPISSSSPGSVPNNTTIISPTPTPKPSPSNQNIILQNVPFTAQAPFGEWSDPRQQDACEEASIIMAMAWINNKGFTLQEAKKIILEMSDWEQAIYGFYQDTSAKDTAKLMNDYYGYSNTEVQKNVSSKDILRELENGNLIIMPTNGQRLGNPNFTGAGPPVHMIVIKGYDYNTDEFITNDPGTRKGENYRYSSAIIDSAIQDYPTGDHHGPQVIGDTAMIIVRK